MLTLRLRVQSPIPLEAECIAPDQLAGKSPAEIERLPVQHGNRQERLADFFDVAGDAADERIELEGDLGRVKWVGTGLTRGEIVVHGSIGTHLGSEMAGGRIVVHGNAGDWVGAEMRGGVIQVYGNAGHQVGAAYRGSRRGMRGGTILIHGSAGNEIGSTMRRGLIAIGGDSGDFPGVSMIAGSVFLFGRLGIRPGAGMKRGTIAAFGPGLGLTTLSLLPSFRPGCVYTPVFVSVYLRHLQACGFPVPVDCHAGTYRRYCGDLVALGLGEILDWCP
jgi:formylmethanofuran dehydrogenase subunit C